MKNREVGQRDFLIILFLMATIVILIGYGNFIYGNKYFLFYDVGADTINSYYPIYIHMIHMIKEGEFQIWDFSIGLGGNIFSFWMQIADPFCWLIVIGGLIFGISFVKYALVLMQILKIYLCIFLCYKYLKQFHFHYRTCGIVSFLYGFHAFLILWGQHYFFGIVSVYIIIYLLLLEKCIQENKKIWYQILCVLSALIAIISVYFAYMILLFSFVYVIIRIFYRYTERQFKKNLIHCFGIFFHIGIGVFLSSFITIPYMATMIGVSSRIESEHSIFEKIIYFLCERKSKLEYMEIFSRMISNNLLGINDIQATTNYYELPQLSFTIFIFIIIGQYFIYLKENFLKKNNRKRLILHIISIFSISFMLLNHLGSAVFNALQYPFGRHTFLIMPIFALMVASVWEKVILPKKINIKMVLISIFFTGSILLWGYDTTGKSKILCCLYLLLNIIFVIDLMLIQKEYVKEKGYILLVILMFLSVIPEVYITNNNRYTYTKETMTENLDKNTVDALQFLKSIDNSFYRVEKMYMDYSDTSDSFLQDYYPATGYQSLTNSNVISFYKKVWPQVFIYDNMSIFRRDSDPAISSALLNVKYVLSKEKIENEYYILLNEFENVKVYQNKLAGSIGIFFDKGISQTVYEKLTEEERKRVLLEYLILSDYEDKEWISNHEIEYQNNQEYQNKNNQFIEIAPTILQGELEIDKSGYLFLAIPYQDGWNITVDGKYVDKILADYGFLAIEVTAGKHIINAEYRIPHLKLGCFCTIISISVIIVFYKSGWIKKIIGFIDEKK